MAKLALYYKRTSLELEYDELEEYLYYLIQQGTTSTNDAKSFI
jgi:hypothetical protein